MVLRRQNCGDPMHSAGAVKGFPLELCYVAQGMDGTNDEGFHSDLHLVENLKKEHGIQPIVHNIRLDYVGWVKMCQKHFRQDV